MIDHQVHTYPSSARLAREDQLAWELAAVATDPVEVPDEVAEVVANRVTMRAALGEIAALCDGQNLLEVYETLAKAMYDAKGLHPNLDYPAGPAYHLIGSDTPTFTLGCVAARLPGWTAHISEQLTANSLIRPLSAYTGPAERPLPRSSGRRLA
jgi:hypothetical protein